MSLRTLAEAIGVAVPPAQKELDGERTGLFFVMNSRFLEPFHILLYSLIRNSSLLDLPVVMISEDATLSNDPIVQLAADRFILAGAGEISQFSKISGRRVAESLKLDWIPKYTYLKWLLFEDYGFERHVFMDADILCINPCNELAAMAEADLYAGPIFEKTMVRDKEGNMLPPDEREANLLAFSNDAVWDKLNSGVLVLNRKTLDSGFRRKLIALAETLDATVEQIIIRRFLRGNPDYTHTLISPHYNFNHGFLAYAGVQAQLALLSRIKLLHFVGVDRKPWDGDGGRRITDSIWHAYAAEARQRHPIFRRAKRRLDASGSDRASGGAETALS